MRLAIPLQCPRAVLAGGERVYARLEHVLGTMVIKAPADGILLHGPLEGALSRAFKPGSQVNAFEAVVSVAKPGDLVLSFTVPAKEILRVKKGLIV